MYMKLAAILALAMTGTSAAAVTATNATTNCDYSSTYFEQRPDMGSQGKSLCWLVDGDLTDDFSFADTPLIAIVNANGQQVTETGDLYDGDPYPGLDLTDLMINSLGGGQYEITYDGPLIITMIGLASASNVELYSFVSGGTYMTTTGQDLSNLGLYNFGVIPLPAAGWLLLAGVGGLAAMRRRKKAA